MKGMTGSEFVAWHKHTVMKMNEIVKAKNQDYSGGGDVYAFNNFEVVEHIGNCSAEQGFITRITDKVSRISNLTRNGTNAVKDESITDTLLDLANYAILMAGYIESKKGVRMAVPKRDNATKMSESVKDFVENY